MVLHTLGLAVVSVLLFTVVHAKTPDGRIHANFARRPSVPAVPILEDVPVTSRDGTTLPPYNTTYYFDQLIDHTNPALGTFKQRFWHTWEWYEAGMRTLDIYATNAQFLQFTGGPIILFTPGEASASGRTVSATHTVTYTLIG